MMSDDSEEEIKPLKRSRKKSIPDVKKNVCKQEIEENIPTDLPKKITTTATASVSTNLSNQTELSSSQELEKLASNNNKARAKYFSVTNNLLPTKKYGLCPVCSIDLNFLHGLSQLAHINQCLDADPKFEGGYCSGDSQCSLANEKHFRQFKHHLKVSSALNAETSGTDENEGFLNAYDKDKDEINDQKEVAFCLDGNDMEDLNSVQNIGNESSKKIANRKLSQTNISSYFSGGKALKASKSEPDRKPVLIRTVDAPVTSKQKRNSCEKKVKKERPRKPCPFYKKIPDTGITVDAFAYGKIVGCTAYLLSHFHSDHYKGLNKNFTGKLYCSQITANLVVSQLHVDESSLVRLPMYQPTMVGDVEVTLIDANHCPGSVMFLLQLRNGERILHVGDYRANQIMFTETKLLTSGVINTLYLDTTYCNPKYTFPPQNDVIEFVIKTAKAYIRQNPKTLIACGTYTIGKERVFRSIAKELGLKIGVTKEKLKILTCLEDNELSDMLSLDYNNAQIHILPLGSFNQKKLSEHLAKYKHKPYNRLLAFRPTGWTFSSSTTNLDDIKPVISNDVYTYGVPYSEHSSFSELKWFVETLKPVKIIPTVNIGSKDSRDAMNKHFTEWLQS